MQQIERWIERRIERNTSEITMANPKTSLLIVYTVGAAPAARTC